jgi:hypothetical protein
MQVQAALNRCALMRSIQKSQSFTYVRVLCRHSMRLPSTPAECVSSFRKVHACICALLIREVHLGNVIANPTEHKHPLASLHSVFAERIGLEQLVRTVGSGSVIRRG